MGQHSSDISGGLMEVPCLVSLHKEVREIGFRVLLCVGYHSAFCAPQPSQQDPSRQFPFSRQEPRHLLGSSFHSLLPFR